MKNKNLCGNCITFGVQGVLAQHEDIKKILIEEKYDYKEMIEDEIILDEITSLGKTAHQSVLFKLLGFSKVDSIDCNSYENATHILNLNEPISPDLHSQYDMVFDGGTTEHCFNIKEVLSNAIRLLKVDGRIIHLLPLSGWINHGFYQFSPILFFDFYGANGFVEMEAKIHIEGAHAYYLDYDPDANLPNDFFGKSVLLFFTAKKKHQIDSVKIPIQNFYSNVFEGKHSTIVANDYPMRNIVKTILRPLPPLLYNIASGVFRYSKYKRLTRGKRRLT